MVNLSVDAINELASYEVVKSNVTGMFEFVTDAGINFTVGFELVEGLLNVELYQFFIVNMDNRKSPRDMKLRETVMAIIQVFFETSNHAMLYICETGDNKQAMRNHLFNYWSNLSPVRKKLYTTTASLPDEDGIMNYATLCLRVDHPDFMAVVNEFSELVHLLGQK